MAEPRIEKLVVGPLSTNCYVLYKGKSAVLIDPAFEWQMLSEFIRKNNLEVKFIINTHTHIDHIAYEDRLGYEVWVHKNEADFLADKNLNFSYILGLELEVRPEKIRIIEKEEKIKAGGFSLEIISTPGHSPGGISILCGRYLFSGDVLFYNSIGRTDIPRGDIVMLEKSVNKLFSLDKDIVVLPGHGPQTTIEREKGRNRLRFL